MNSQLRNLLIVAMAASLPLGLTAQSSSSSSSTPSSTSNQTGSANQTGVSDRSGSSSSTPSSSSTMRTPSSSTASSSTGGAAGVGSIRRLNDDAVERQFTAKDLIGKEVYDSSGKRIGEVKDIVLSSSTNPQLSSGLQGHGMASSDTSTARSSSSGTTRTASGSIGGVGASGSVTTGGDTGVSASGTLGGTSKAGAASGNEMARHAQSMMGAMSENAVIVSYGGFLGAGSSLLRVPLSQLNYDNSNERITVNVAESELSSLPEATETSRSAAE